MIPFATTTIRVQDMVEPEPGEARTPVVVASGVRAVIGSPSGSELQRDGGGSSRVTDVLDCDPVPGLSHTCQVVDEVTGAVYEVEWVRQRQGLGLDHTKAGLAQIVGAGR